MNVRTLQRLIWNLIRGLIVISICFVILRPVLTKFVSSFMTEWDIWDQTVRWVPRSLTLENYRAMFEFMRYPQAALNSLVFSFSIAAAQLVSCTIVGYGFARFRFRGSSLLFGLVIFTLLVPPQIIVLPLYLNFRYFTVWGILPEPGLDLIGSYWPFMLMALSATGFKNGLFIYILRQFFKNMPKSLEEAAYIDGAGPFRTFLTVMLPGAIPALVIVFLFAFVWQWNDYFFTSIFMRDGRMLAHTLDIAAESYAHAMGTTLTGQYISLLNNTGMLMFIAPLLLLYAVMQKYFVESIERTGIIG